MHIKVFKTSEAEEANKFIDSVQLVDNRVEVQNGEIYVFYRPNLSVEHQEEKQLRERIRGAEESLVEARLHRGFLNVTDIGDEKKITEAKEMNEREIKNIEARLKLYREWRGQEN